MKKNLFLTLTWLGTIFTIVSFALYLLDVTSLINIKNVSVWIFFIIVIISIVISIIFTYITKDRFSKQQIQAFNSIIGDMGYKLQTMNIELQNLKVTKEKCLGLRQKMINVSVSEITQIREEFINYLIFRLDKIDSISLDIKPSVKDIEIISKTKITIGDINAFYNNIYPNFFQEIKDFYLKIKALDFYLMSNDWLNKAIEKNFEMIQVSSEMIYFSFLELISEMPQPVKENFYENLVPYLTQYPAVKMLSKIEAKGMADRSYNQYQSLLNDFASIVGSEELNILLIEQDIERLKMKNELNETLKEQLQIKKMQLKQSREKLSLLLNAKFSEKKK